MLSVVSIKSSSVSSGYYLKQDGDYYIEQQDQTALYQWYGKGAEKLGLLGDVSKDQFEAIFSGRLPNGEVVGKKGPDGIHPGRPGYDLTFSMNKELSLIISCTKDSSLRDYFLKAHHQAVKTALGEVEEKVQARVTIAGVTQYETTQNMVSALCTHFSSRAGDPQIHTHVCVANVTERSDGKWRALATDLQRKQGFFEAVRDHAVYFGALYQNEMACAVKQKGFVIESLHNNGLFQIVGIPDGMREHFSKRREQIKDIIAKMGPEALGNKKLYAAVAQHSKASKKSIGAESFFEKAQTDMQNYLTNQGEHRSFDEIIRICQEKEKAPQHKSSDMTLVPATAREAVTDAIHYLSQFSVTLDAYRILNKAMQLNLGNADHKALHQALKDSISSGDLLKTEDGKLTSQYLIDAEKSLMNTAKDAINDSVIGKYGIPKDRQDFQEILKEALTQSRLCVVSEPRQLVDKHVLLDQMIPILEKQYKQVHVLAANRSLSHQHNDAARQKDVTLWQRLSRIGKGDLASSLGGFLHQLEKEKSSPMLNWFQKKANAVYIVDDAQRISRDSLQQLIALTERSEARIIFLKHTEGRNGVLSGNPLELVERSGVHHIDAREAFATQKIKSPIHVECHEALTDSSKSSEKQTARQNLCATTVGKQSILELNSTQVLTHSKSSADKLNGLIREERIRNNFIDSVSQKVMVSAPLYLSREEQKHAKFYPIGAEIKTYLGKGQFKTDTILRHDLVSNKLVIQSELGRSSLISPHTLSERLKTHRIQLIEAKELVLAIGDRCRVTHDNRVTKASGLKLDSIYTVVSFSKKHLEFQANDAEGKRFRIAPKALSEIALTYAYARSVHDIGSLKSKDKIIAELPHHALNQNVIADLLRMTDHLTIITDNKVKAEKKIKVAERKDQALDQKIVNPDDARSLAQKAMDYAIGVVSSREAAFNQETLLKAALNFNTGSCTHNDLRMALTEVIQSGDLFYRQTDFGETVFALPAAVDLEKRIIHQIKEGKGQVTPFLSETSAHQFLENKRLVQNSPLALTRGQEEACQLIATTADRFVMVQGYAGTGKSTMLETLVGTTEKSSGGLHRALEVMLPKDSKILALAPTHQAVHELKTKGIEAQTLKSFLVDQAALENSATRKNELVNTLIIVDESSMISNTDFHEFQRIVESQKARCAYIGDVAQLSAVEAGKPSELIYISKEAGIATAIMDEHIRQTNPELKTIAGLLMQGGTEGFSKAFALLENHGLIQEDKTAAMTCLSEHYTSLSEAGRAQTLIAVATNKDREALNNVIRESLMAKGILAGPVVSGTKLVDSRLTTTELSMAQAYQPGMKVKYNDVYYSILNRDTENNTITLLDNNNQKTLLPLSLLAQKSVLELYVPKATSIVAGELIKFTKTNRDQKRFANTPLTVKTVESQSQSFVAEAPDGKTHCIQMNLRSDQHIDYRYCSTTHGLQGATAQSALIYLNGANQRSNTMRQLYVALTRAKEKVLIFTNDAKAVKQQILQNAGEKASALQAMGLLETKTWSQVRQPRSKTSETLASKPRLDAKVIEQKLRDQSSVVVKNLLGKPNPGLSNAIHWRYGSKGSLSITVEGDRAGLFHNFETGEKGGMIRLIMSEHGVNFKEALEIADRLLGGSEHHFHHDKKDKLSSKDPADAANLLHQKREYIQKLINRSKPIQNTVAETYLKNRAIQDCHNTDLRFLDHVKTGEGNTLIKPFSAALLAIAKDEKGHPVAIQLTYLDKNSGEKIAGLSVPKRTIGVMKGAAVNLTPTVKNPALTFVAEGIETALSIRDATKNLKNAQVIATLGKQNMAHISTTSLAREIVLVLDNDLKNPKEDRAIQSATLSLKAQHREVQSILPTTLNQKKTDYNDLARAGKFDAILKDVINTSSNKTGSEGLSPHNIAKSHQRLVVEKEL